MGLFNLLRKPGNQSNASRAVQARGSATSQGSSGGATAPSSAAAVGGDSLRTSCSSTGSEELRPPVKRSSSFNRRPDGLRSCGCSAGGSGGVSGATPTVPLRRGAIEVLAPCASGTLGIAGGAGAATAPDRCMRLPAAAVVMDRRRGDAAGAGLEALFADVALIHRGRNALIYRARDPENRRAVILKAYDPRKGASAEREVTVLRDAGPHPGLIRLEAVVEVPAAPTTLVLEAAGGGTLIEAIANNGGRLPERVAARRVVAPLLRALAHLHSRGIVHRDLKPEHVLLAPDGPRITDFATAAYLPRPPTAEELAAGATARPRRVSVGGGHGPQSELLNHRIAGAAVEYMAPEVLGFPTASEVFHLVIASGLDEEDLPTHDEKVDVWSLGVLTYEALTGRQPFLADGAAEMASIVAQRLAARADTEASGSGGGAVGSGQPAFIARAPGLSQDARDFLTRCLQANPAARPAAADLLQHPWLARRTSLDAITAARRASLDAAAAARRGSIDVTAGSSSGSGGGGSSGGGGAVKRTSAVAGLGCPAAAAAAAAAALRHSLSAPGSSEGTGAPHSRRVSLAQRDSGSGSGDSRGGGGAEAARANAMTSLHRSVSVADATEVHLTMRSATGRLEGALPGRRASAAANLASGRSSDGS